MSNLTLYNEKWQHVAQAVDVPIAARLAQHTPNLAQDRPNMAGAWPKKDGFPQPRPNFF